MKEHLSLESTALIIVDVQNDFCHEDGACARMGRDVKGAQAIVPSIQLLIGECRERGVPVIFIQMTQEPHTLSEAWNMRPRPAGTEGIAVTQRNSWGADFYKLTPKPDDIIVEKHRYSAFIGTQLDLILRTMNIKSLLVTGVATNVCVESTARDGFMLDYHVTVVKDACAGYSPELHEATFGNVTAHFGRVLETGEILSYWKEHQSLTV
ncbi:MULTISPECIES: isochorismatase family cysteine hydrolase [unclassified Paenibacillus]|uniref:cysteine hydrolase family protein n=1 Tax=unclassified Paenibacillus TaxID=185978 RepID=UPI00240566BF|nr:MULTISPECIES: isochorismatase family cysteine hydrolase [unclassified Paenibacillus]MDF9839753.1 ureidoacrylate peracid hydrolase [Paenibacillus sp. PastF-2]MDF9846333.1 ureidoacrylate peracid hydrolase [Paenibacillus sp. PastM-2]MDF9853317.1 ureidoacrylate peracid hydrolase [Paenibacillus sp. PastF-1]MDH6478179.1 ureidoacrylate peracid hydrolase [Paenibacillus sp. PastH-2]MDH6506322.1 ureidoacrylate peracid hydrolase [Paenibacillus sp. PastM-3]